jgi:hypothetical protein
VTPIIISGKRIANRLVPPVVSIGDDTASASFVRSRP